MILASRTSNQRSISTHLLIGFAITVLLVIGVGGWSATAQISGAVIAQGTVVVESNVKHVQHPSGGIVGEILARNGDKVDAGDIVVRLDATISRANLAIVNKQLAELRIRKARLESERDGATELALPEEILSQLNLPDIARLVAGEQKLFSSRRASRLGQKSQLRQRIAQLQEEIRGLTGQKVAKDKEIKFVHRELEGARSLWARNLMPITKMTELERQAARIEGERAQLTSSAARSKGRISEIELQIIQIDRDLASEVGKELSQANAKIGELIEREIAALDQQKRIDIRAPQAGTVHQSTAHTVGGVISGGETIMLIVPEAANLAVEARVAPTDIDQLRLGQPVMLRFSAFSQRTTPEITGTLDRISADISTDERSGERYYTVRIGVAEAEVANLGGRALVPGMPVEVFVKTVDRNVITYLIKPLSDQIERAFREE